MLDIMIIIMVIAILPIIIILEILYIINKYLKNKFKPGEDILQKIDESKSRKAINFMIILILFIINIYEIKINIYIYALFIFIIPIIEAVISLKYVKDKQEDKNTYNYIIYKAVSGCILIFSILILYTIYI